jgi:hypothetical protein
MTNKTKLLITVMLFVLSIILFYLVNLFTIDPKRTSGNGNLGLIPMMFAVPIFITFNLFYFLILYNYLGTISKKIQDYTFIGAMMITTSIGSRQRRRGSLTAHFDRQVWSSDP